VRKEEMLSYLDSLGSKIAIKCRENLCVKMLYCEKSASDIKLYLTFECRLSRPLLHNAQWVCVCVSFSSVKTYQNVLSHSFVDNLRLLWFLYWRSLTIPLYLSPFFMLFYPLHTFMNNLCMNIVDNSLLKSSLKQAANSLSFSALEKNCHCRHQTLKHKEGI
jgi:hypothetical protein